MSSETKGRARGGEQRAINLSPERRKEISENAIKAKSELASLPRATHGSNDNPLRIADIEIPCYVLEDGTRVLSQNGLQTSIGMSLSGGVAGEQRVASLLSKIAEKGIDIKDLSARIKSPILFRPPHGGNAAYGFEATVLADVCDILLAARNADVLTPGQKRYADQAEILIRGFARVGIIALVDEATGYQRDRERDALAKILEAFVAKELQPYVRTFPPEYYEELFRLRSLPYPPSNPRFRPQYFGVLTNDIVYERLAPGLLEELKKQAKKDEKKAHLHRRLTQEIGHPKLREHLASIVTAMKLSDDYPDFIKKLNKIHPRYNPQAPLELEKDDR